MKYVKKSGQEVPVDHVRFRNIDTDFSARRTVHILITGTVEDAKALLKEQERWSIVERNDDGVMVKEKDCTEYEKLLEVRDHMDGTVSVIFGTAKMEEIMQVLTGGNET